ncbi:hypothetical protein J1N35_008463, partial [Gossypium stocksii]
PKSTGSSEEHLIKKHRIAISYNKKFKRALTRSSQRALNREAHEEPYNGTLIRAAVTINRDALKSYKREARKNNITGSLRGLITGRSFKLR